MLLSFCLTLLSGVWGSVLCIRWFESPHCYQAWGEGVLCIGLCALSRVVLLQLCAVCARAYVLLPVAGAVLTFSFFEASGIEPKKLLAGSSH